MLVQWLTWKHGERITTVKLGFVVGAMFAGCCVVSPTLLPQQQARFEVASVRPSDPKGGITGVLTYPGGKIRASYCTLDMLLEAALDVQRFQLVGGPEWVHSAKFDIVAQPPATSKSSLANPPTPKAPLNDEQRQMLLALLQERFNLAFHRESRSGPVYLLERGKGKLLLTPPANPKEFSWAGGVGGGLPSGDGIQGINITMSQFANRLSHFLQRPVVDHTDISGAFDFKYYYDADDNESSEDNLRSSIFTSVNGLGLRLRGGKGPIDMVVIDRANKPEDEN